MNMVSSMQSWNKNLPKNSNLRRTELASFLDFGLLVIFWIWRLGGGDGNPTHGSHSGYHLLAGRVGQFFLHFQFISASPGVELWCNGGMHIVGKTHTALQVYIEKAVMESSMIWSNYSSFEIVVDRIYENSNWWWHLLLKPVDLRRALNLIRIYCTNLCKLVINKSNRQLKHNIWFDEK